MKKLTFIIISLVIFQLSALSQSCLPEGITFTTQAEIDSFQSDYPGCTEIEGDVTIDGGNSIYNLNGLGVLTSIGRFIGIYFTYALTSLTGLDNIEAGSIIDLYIEYNPNLSSCAVQSICDYLAAPNGGITIGDNAPGCNSPEQVDSACVYVSVQEILFEELCYVYPNPLSYSATIEYKLIESSMVHFTVYNHLGQQIETLVNQHQQQGKHQAVWNAEGLPSGIYFYRLQAGEQQATGKMVVLR